MQSTTASVRRACRPRQPGFLSFPNSHQRCISRRPCQRFYSTSPNAAGKQRSAHGQWYAETMPSMIPIALLGSAVYMGLQLLQLDLSHEKFLDEANARIRKLEEDLASLRQAHREEGEKIVPPVVDKKKSWWFTST